MPSLRLILMEEPTTATAVMAASSSMDLVTIHVVRCIGLDTDDFGAEGRAEPA